MSLCFAIRFWLSIRIRFSLSLTRREHVFMKCWCTSGPCVTPCQPMRSCEWVHRFWVTLCNREFDSVKTVFSKQGIFFSKLYFFFFLTILILFFPAEWILSTVFHSISCCEYTNLAVVAFQLSSEVWHAEIWIEWHRGGWNRRYAFDHLEHLERVREYQLSETTN